MGYQYRYFNDPHEDEIARLGQRHEAWRPIVQNLWQEAGLRTGMTVFDACAGPGYSAFDLAGIVGKDGYVVAFEQPKGFARSLGEAARKRGVSNLAVMEVSPADYVWPTAIADAIWSWWGLIAVDEPADLLSGLTKALKPGGVLILQEYYDYASWRLAPRSVEFDDYVSKIVDYWRGGKRELDVGLIVPCVLEKLGMEIELLRPAIFAVKPGDRMWMWPGMGARSYASLLADAGAIREEEATNVSDILARYESDTASVMVTPGVFQIVARKPA